MPHENIDHLIPLIRADQIAYAYSLVEVRADENECFEWHGTHSAEGYGRVGFTLAGIGCKRFAAHRLMYILARGQIGMLVIDHLCNNKGCVNVRHLAAVTQQRNTSRYHDENPVLICGSGLHEMSGGNVMIRADGRRTCRTCKYEKVNANKRRIYAERKAAGENPKLPRWKAREAALRTTPEPNLEES